jgi:outer membrane protein TolC
MGLFDFKEDFSHVMPSIVVVRNKMNILTKNRDLFFRMLFATLVLLPGSAYGVQEIDLEQAINLALKQNRNLLLSVFSTQSASFGIAAANAEFRISARPVANLDTNDRGEVSSRYGLNVSKKLHTGTVLSSSLVSEDLGGFADRQENFRIGIEQPLFRNSGHLVNEEPLVQANQNLLSALRRLELQKIDLTVEVVRSYENILRLKEQLRADKKSHERASALYRRTKAMEALGRSTRVDTLRVELQRGQALSRLEADKESFSSAQATFSELLGFKPDTLFDLIPTRLLEVDLPPIEEAVRISFKNRLEFAQVLQDAEDAERGLKIAQKRLWPDVRLVARYDHTNTDDSLELGLDQNQWFVGLSADTDFNLAVERATLGQAKLAGKSSNQLIRVQKLSIARELQQSILLYRRAHAELKILIRNLQHAAARLQLAQRLFDIGRGDNFSVTDAEEAFLQAESQLLFSQSTASISGYELLRAMGILTEVPDKLKPAVL